VPQDCDCSHLRLIGHPNNPIRLLRFFYLSCGKPPVAEGFFCASENFFIFQLFSRKNFPPLRKPASLSAVALYQQLFV
jgi:hypothetical protein